MLKQVTLLKRKPGLSRAEFIDYYERHHSKLAERFLWRATRYQRRYVQPCVNPITGDAAELDFDVVMEIWWASRADFDVTMAIAIGFHHRTEKTGARPQGRFQFAHIVREIFKMDHGSGRSKSHRLILTLAELQNLV